MNREHATRITRKFTGKKILVIGDLMLDEFIWGRVSRISPEAPVPVVSVTSESYYPGGSANVARNVREFTPCTSVLGAVGRDPHGNRLVELLLACGIDTAGVQQHAGLVTTVKSRIIARNQQVVRVDRERKTPLAPEQLQRALADCEAAIPTVDGIVVADYGKGFLTQKIADLICSLALAHGKILSVDPHPHTSLSWHGATAVKPNRLEAFLAAGIAPSDPIEPVLRDEALLEAGRRLLERWKPRSLLVTLGEQGMLLFQPDTAPRHIPTCAKEVLDVSGAGDTAIGVFTLALCAGATPDEAAELANHASGIVVGKLGTATTGLEELEASFAP